MSELEFEAFAQRLTAFMEACRAGATPQAADESDRLFDDLARELFDLQFRSVEPYRHFCEVRGIRPERLGHWNKIPAVVAAAFKAFPLTSLAERERTVVFQSSGTTGQSRSRHFHNARSLQVYRTSILNWFELHLLPNHTPLRRAPLEEARAIRWLFLTPPPDQAPDSSLVHMFAVVLEELAGEGSGFCGCLKNDGAWHLDLSRLLPLLSEAENDGRPLALLGTAFSFVQLLDELARRGLSHRLPLGSRVMETGGYKGRSRELSKPELYRQLSARLGVPDSGIVSEYGMSELSSQAYDRRALTADSKRGFRFPPWARVRIIDPETGQASGDGNVGLIQVVDLANVRSVMAVQTEDLGLSYGETFEWCGRMGTAETRGCSLRSSDFHESSRPLL